MSTNFLKFFLKFVKRIFKRKITTCFLLYISIYYKAQRSSSDGFGNILSFDVYFFDLKLFFYISQSDQHGGYCDFPQLEVDFLHLKIISTSPEANSDMKSSFIRTRGLFGCFDSIFFSCSRWNFCTLKVFNCLFRDCPILISQIVISRLSPIQILADRSRILIND